MVSAPWFFWLGVLLISAQSAQANDALGFFKNYFVTGDYAAGGTSLLGRGVKSTATQTITGGVSTYASGVIHMSGVPGYYSNSVPQIPQHADIVAAYLYWETLASSNSDPTKLAKGTFRGLKVVGTQVAANGAKACGAFGDLANLGGGQTQYVFRADVLKYLPYKRDPATGRPTGDRLVNDADLTANGFAPHTVSLPDSGIGWLLSFFTHQSAYLTEGASLVVVYRIAGAPLKSVVLYDGGFALSSQNPQMTQTIQGFYQASKSSPPVAKMTQIVGDGFCLFKEQLTVNGFVPTGVSPTNPFKSALFGTTWTTLTFDVSNLMRGNDSTVMTSVVPLSPAGTDCLSWSAIVFSTTVQASDGDGLLDIWKTSVPVDPNGVALPNIQAMDAKTGQKDIFVEIDYMRTTGYTNLAQGIVPEHSHLPTLEALRKVAAAFLVKGSHIHFDVGNNYQPSSPTTPVTPRPDFIVPANLALGGDAIDEVSSSCSGPQSSTYLFPNYPGTTSWKDGFQLIKNGGTFGGTPLLPHFDHNRKDIFHYAFFAHALALPKWRTNDKTLTSIVVSTGTATATTQLKHGLSTGNMITVLAATATSGLNTTSTAYSVSGVSDTTFTFPTTAKAGTYQNWGLAVSNGTPRSNSGVSDVGGGDLMVTLGLWDNSVGTDFMQASTLLHELGHNLDLGHGGDSSDPVNCKPNYQSTMSYMFQVQGLLDQYGNRHIDYSTQTLPAPNVTLNESSLNETSRLGAGPLAYLPRWYAPFVPNGPYGSPAKKHCDGTPFTDNAKMVRIDGTSVNASTLNWDGDGSAVDTSLSQDVNFDGTISNAGFQGFYDWMHIDLQQVGARRGAAGSSDDVGPGQDNGDDQGIAGGDLGIAGGDLGIAGGDLGIAGGDLGIAGGDLGIAGGDLGAAAGELDFETATAVPGAPSGLNATPLVDGVGLNWTAPSAGSPSGYTVWRAICNDPACATASSFAPVVAGSACQVNQISYNFCDYLPVSIDDSHFLYYVTATYIDSNNVSTTSGPSNQVKGSEATIPAPSLSANGITDGVGLTWPLLSLGKTTTYTVYRATCQSPIALPATSCPTVDSPAIIGSSSSPGICPANTTYNYCDNLSAATDDGYYTYYVTATSGDDTSGPSNTVVQTESSVEGPF
jgi:hypothetical protein